MSERDLRRARRVQFSKFLPPGVDAVLIEVPVMIDLAKAGMSYRDGTETHLTETIPTAVLRDGFGIDEREEGA